MLFGPFVPNCFLTIRAFLVLHADIAISTYDPDYGPHVNISFLSGLPRNPDYCEYIEIISSGFFFLSVRENCGGKFVAEHFCGSCWKVGFLFMFQVPFRNASGTQHRCFRPLSVSKSFYYVQLIIIRLETKSAGSVC